MPELFEREIAGRTFSMEVGQVAGLANGAVVLRSGETIILVTPPALSISDIPFSGPVSGVRIGYIDDEYVVNPTFAQLKDSKLDLVVAGTREAVVMVEDGASESPEAVILEAIRLGQEVNAEIIGIQDQMVSKVGKPKREFEPGGTPDEVRQA